MSTNEGRETKLRGFAAMKAAGRGDEVRATASAGGKKAHLVKTAHKWNSSEAKAAGRLGGLARHAKRREAKARSQEMAVVGHEDES